MPGIGGVLRRQWTIGLFAAAVVMVAAVLSLATQSTRHVAEAEVVIPLAAVELPLRVGDPATSRATIDTEARWASSAEVQDQIRDRVGPGVDIDVTAPLGSQSLVITATARSADGAVAAADIAAEVVVDLRSERLVDDATTAIDALTSLDADLGDVDPADESPEAALRQRYAELIVALESVVALVDDVGPRIASPAAGDAAAATGPAVGARLALALAAAVALGLAAALVRDRLDRPVRGAPDVAGADLVLLGTLPMSTVASSGGEPPASLRDADSAAAESVRALRLAIAAHEGDTPTRSLLVAGPRHGSGAAAVATHLAVAVARSGARCILVDADLRAPAVPHLLDLDDEVGLTSVLAGDIGLEAAVVRPASAPGLVVLTPGPQPAHPGDLLAGARTRSLVTSMVEQADLVVVVAPPLLDVADGLTLATLVDTTMVVASTESTTTDDLRRVVDLFDAHGVHAIGCALVGATGAFAVSTDTVLDLRDVDRGPSEIEDLDEVDEVEDWDGEWDDEVEGDGDLDDDYTSVAEAERD